VVVRQDIQERQQGWNGVLQGLVEGQELSSDLGSHGTWIIRVLHIDIALE
jgi:hypothetical protein